MKACIVIPNIDKTFGGPSRSVPMLAKGLSCEGISITLLTVETDDMNYHILDDSSVKLIAIKKNAKKQYLESIIIKGNYDIIHLQNLWDPFLHKVAIIARKYKIPYIMTPRGTLEPWSLSQKKLKKALALSIYQMKDLQKAECILATSNMEADNIRKLGIQTPIAIIPNGIDLTEYPCRDIECNNRIKKQIVFISRIHKKKGLEILIDAWSIIHSNYKDWSIVIAGNGEDCYINYLKKRIQSKNLQNSITIIPPVFGKDKIDLYQTSSLFVLPTYSENFGMVIAEALSCGLPVITTTGTPWHELNNNNIGWCIDLNITNVARTISSAIDRGIENLFIMGQRGSLYVKENYDFMKVASKNKLLYDWILKKDKQPEWIKR